MITQLPNIRTIKVGKRGQPQKNIYLKMHPLYTCIRLMIDPVLLDNQLIIPQLINKKIFCSNHKIKDSELFWD